jgi:hypothetical protein
MGKYDSPGYQDQVPGYPPRNSHDYGTAPGSPGDAASETYGGTVGSPPVSILYGSSQVPSFRPTLAVLDGDTSAMSSDQSVPANLPGVTPPSEGNEMATTGAGAGSAGAHKHPNAGE